MEKQHAQYRFQLYIRGIILIGFTLLMLKLVITGNMVHFIAPKMMPFMNFAIIVFALLGAIQIWRSCSKKQAELYCDCGTDHAVSSSPIKTLLVYSLFVFPIITGFLFPDVVLDSSVAAKRGFKTNLEEQDTSKAEAYLSDPEAYLNELDESVGNKVAQSSNIPDVPLEHPEGFEVQEKPVDFYAQLEQKMLEMETIQFTEENFIAMTSILDENPDKFVGKKVEMLGFVFREHDFKENQFVIARFGLSCCVADASVFGTLATSPEAETLGDDQWVKLTGTITTVKYQDWTLPSIEVSEIDRVEQPESPYVYESY
ncbi:TIGR03943 family protein [Bacillus sp. AFS040349]|uniref:TIGR03943 family putative permease subunit n=1 Tax=Bacillus sp. AFS040349 TaxID=2033502 RepID=UPI000BFDAB2C|nr:TIGR03943 family protein [Bacillus sp. AFS040349]PGT91111.1 TIGR03943 family protein [Bacillus sp. AFS040349]